MVIHDQLADGREMFLATALSTVRYEQIRPSIKSPIRWFYHFHYRELLLKTEFRALTGLLLLILKYVIYSTYFFLLIIKVTPVYFEKSLAYC